MTWIDISSGAPTVLRVLSDSRLVDPISVEDNNNHGTQSDLIDIADYGDKNVKAYRYGPVIEWTTRGTPGFGRRFRPEPIRLSTRELMQRRLARSRSLMKMFHNLQYNRLEETLHQSVH